MQHGHVGVVGSGADLVHASAGVGCGRELPGWDGRSIGVGDDGVVLVLLRLVLEQCLVEVLEFVPFGGTVVVAWIWVFLIGGSRNEP